MIGTGVLLECLEDPDVESVVTVGRSTSPIAHPKLRQVRHADFFDYRAIREDLAGRDACFFCLGVSSAGMSEDEYTHLTYTLTLVAAKTLAEQNPGMTFCYVSGQGTAAGGRMMWARVKGRTENDLMGLSLDAYMFRPGFVVPTKGVRSKTRLYQAFYTVLRPLFPAMRRIAPAWTTTSENIGRAMLRVARDGYVSRTLENRDIDGLGGGGRNGGATEGG